jgi:hypothetical protein
MCSDDIDLTPQVHTKKVSPTLIHPAISSKNNRTTIFAMITINQVLASQMHTIVGDDLAARDGLKNLT